MEMEYALSLALRFVVAGSVVVGISVAAEKLKNPLLAGILMMMPSITIVSVYFIGKSMGMAAAGTVLFWSLVGLPVWIAYAVSLYYFLYHMDLVPAIVCSMIVFLAGATLMVLIKEKAIFG